VSAESWEFGPDAYSSSPPTRQRAEPPVRQPARRATEYVRPARPGDGPLLEVRPRYAFEAVRPGRSPGGEMPRMTASRWDGIGGLIERGQDKDGWWWRCVEHGCRRFRGPFAQETDARVDGRNHEWYAHEYARRQQREADRFEELERQRERRRETGRNRRARRGRAR
jgi:hypothetical protein